MIIQRLVVGPFGANCYIVGSESDREAMIIDPGAEAKRILKMVDDLKLDIKLIVLTHGHVDHIDGVKEIKEATGAPVAIHTDDIKTLNDDPLSKLLGFSRQPMPPPDRLLKDNDKIDIGDGLHFVVLHTPGHSPGGICLLGGGVVFSGDTLFSFGIGRADLPGGNADQLMDSIRTRLMVLDDETIVYPGHGQKTTIGAERRGNAFL